MADELAGQTANLHLDEVTGERVRSVLHPHTLNLRFSLTSQQQERTQKAQQATRARREESRQSCCSAPQGPEEYIG